MNSEQSQIIDRIKKLLALSTSSNEAEAALAAARAQELLQKHNLSMGVVEDSNQQTAQQMAQQMATDWLGTRLQPHVSILARACNDMFDVSFFYKHKYVESNSWRSQYQKQIVFIGLPANVEAAVLTHAYLCAAVNALARQRAREGTVNGTSVLRDYKLGAADRIRFTIRAHKNRLTTVDAATAALVRISSAVAQRALDALKLPGSVRVNVGVCARDAYNLGHTDGAKLNPYAARTSRMLDAS